jgi:glycosyltransferase involved in cell wall biosynthesis
VHVILDISRLLNVARRAAPTGIDRVELAYAHRWSADPDSRCTFVAELPLIGFAALPRPIVADLVAALGTAWLHGGRSAAAAARRARLALPFGRGALVEVLRRPEPKAFLLVSHRALERPARIAAMRRQGCRFVPLIHDLIPLQHPEFARAGQAEKHRRRIATTASLADAIVVNSAATGAELTPWLAARPVPPLVAVAPLGVTPPQVDAPPVALRPYFVALGTIEPRKNHLLLLNLWRQFAASMGPAAPRLVVVGRRGWENENVLDMLERCSAIDGLVRETGPLPDHEVASLLRGARALLFPPSRKASACRWPRPWRSAFRRWPPTCRRCAKWAATSRTTSTRWTAPLAQRGAGLRPHRQPRAARPARAPRELDAAELGRPFRAVDWLLDGLGQQPGSARPARPGRVPTRRRVPAMDGVGREEDRP